MMFRPVVLASLVAVLPVSLPARAADGNAEQTDEPVGECAEPVTRLATVPAERVEEALGATIREVLEIVWRGNNEYPYREARCEVAIVGKVLIGSSPHEFTLGVDQEGGTQRYRLDISDYGTLLLEVPVAPDAGEARYTLALGEGPSESGTIDRAEPGSTVVPPG